MHAHTVIFEVASYIATSDCLDSSDEIDYTFSHEEHTKFTKRYDNGYDITTDRRYNKWVEIYHPTEVQSANGNCLANYVATSHA